ncbi:trimethylamine methyltransferase family protein [Chloroflexota bacterium]
MGQNGYKRKFDPLKILTEEQVDMIHNSVLQVLEETGLRIEHDKALKLLESNGCQVDYTIKRVKFPPSLVEECLRKCPKSFRVKARNPEHDVILGEDTLYFKTASGMDTVDLDTWEPRRPTKKEFYEALIVLDALDNPQLTGSYVPWFGFEGVPHVMCIPEGFAARVINTSKPLSTAHAYDCEVFTIEMAKAVGAETFSAPSPSAPLTYYGDAIEALFRFLEAGFPVRFVNGEVMGATSPATIAGSVVTCNATQMAAIVLAQLIKPGARVAVLPQSMAQNMRSGLCAFGNIGESLQRAASNQYWRRFEIPIQNNCGFSSSKLPDFQCGYERTLQAITSALTGSNVIQQCGAMYGELTWHPIQSILDDDVASMIGRFIEGILVNDETLAINLINEVGPIPGMYLDKAHTRKWWKSEQVIPKSADTLGIPEWMEKGKKSAIDYATEQMQNILSTHKPVLLSSKQETEIERILKEARDYYRKRGLISQHEWEVYMKCLA